ncbi:MAG: ATP-binding protein [Eubacteriales bacterium]|nr:ATP-binding protein [Eubacteriales bacterium]
MKKRQARRSITTNITIWFSIVLVVIVVLTFRIFWFVSASILQKTIREYLYSSVEENCDKIRFLSSRENADPYDLDDFYIRYGEGWMEVDDDFVDTINDVHSALYTTDGTMLYGKNPIARDIGLQQFKDSRIYEYRTASNQRYYVYDRKLNSKNMEGLWIRGIVSLSSEEKQLNDIFRSAMIYIPILLAAGVIVSYVTVRGSMAPIRRIEQVTSEITRGDDLKRRIDIGDVARELYDLAASFNNMLDRLGHSFEAEHQFTSDASHELRTPTSVIMAQTEFALDRERTAEEYRSALIVIARQGRRMNALIKDMLDYTRLELRPGNYPMERLDLSGLTESTAEDMAMIGLKNIHMKTEIEQGVFVRGNRLLLERVVQNLVDNAYKYGKENGHIMVRLMHLPKDTDHAAAKPQGFLMGGFREIREDSGETERDIVLMVEDDGNGIPEEEQERIFERFYRGDPSRNASGIAYGTGLGLSMVKKIAEIHGAVIKVKSAVGEGTIFSVYFRTDTL